MKLGCQALLFGFVILCQMMDVPQMAQMIKYRLKIKILTEKFKF
jgi:hypothetical protein